MLRADTTVVDPVGNVLDNGGEGYHSSSSASTCGPKRHPQSDDKSVNLASLAEFGRFAGKFPVTVRVIAHSR